MLKWFVYRCPFGKELDLQKKIQILYGVECFVPTEKVRQKDRHGRFVWVQRSVLTGYLFVHIEREILFQIPRRLIALRIMSRMEEGLLTPVVVRDSDMESFIRVSGNKEERIVYLDPAKLNFKKGDRVRVIGGTFVGEEGDSAVGRLDCGGYRSYPCRTGGEDTGTRSRNRWKIAR